MIYELIGNNIAVTNSETNFIPINVISVDKYILSVK